MTVVEHLSELRYRLMVCIAAVAVGAIFCFIFASPIIGWFLDFYRNATDGKRNAFIFTGPIDAFATRIKVATYGGIVLASPVWLYQLWRFITPGLNPKEKRYAIPFLIASVTLFLLGAGGDNLKPLLTADKFLSLVSLMIVAFGVAFEFPVVLMFLLIARIVNTQQLRSFRRWAIVLIFAFAAIITPSQDPYSLFLMAIPLVIFYEACIVIGRIMKR